MSETHNVSKDELFEMLNQEIELKNIYRDFFIETTDVLIENSELHQRMSKIMERVLSTQYKLGEKDKNQ